MLAKLARHTLREKGKTVQLWNWPRVWRKCLDGEWDILDHLIELPILILDDVGAEFTGTRKTADLNTARLYEIAEGRLGKWTFITSNLNLDQMERDLGSRFVSRIFRGNSQIVDLTCAADYSFQQWKARNPQPTTK
jgi:DNA replication protein DnaC